MNEPATNIEASSAMQVEATTGGPEQADVALVRAAVLLEQLKGQANMAGLQLAFAPRDHDNFLRELQKVQTTLTQTWDAYSTFAALRGCVGSA